MRLYLQLLSWIDMPVSCFSTFSDELRDWSDITLFREDEPPWVWPSGVNQGQIFNVQLTTAVHWQPSPWTPERPTPGARKRSSFSQAKRTLKGRNNYRRGRMKPPRKHWLIKLQRSLRVESLLQSSQNAEFVTKLQDCNTKVHHSPIAPQS